MNLEQRPPLGRVAILILLFFMTVMLFLFDFEWVGCVGLVGGGGGSRRGN